MITPVETREGARSSRFWLLLVVGLAVLVALAAVVLNGMVDAGNGELQLGNGSDAGAPVGEVSTTLPRVVSGDPTGDFALGDDPVADGAALACSRFRDGDTVVDFAAWFETEVNLEGPAQQELFQSIIVRALTESCPDVVPTDRD